VALDQHRPSEETAQLHVGEQRMVEGGGGTVATLSDPSMPSTPSVSGSGGVAMREGILAHRTPAYLVVRRASPLRAAEPCQTKGAPERAQQRRRAIVSLAHPEVEVLRQRYRPLASSLLSPVLAARRRHLAHLPQGERQDNQQI